ncbi:unnamed protein product [Owenia fusiformis]|uniref:Uncharacterized protein n=1 Tax=Owenia fusiformis TaxID=6347 RepID=A0A8S4PZP4_OWEFU|nr:unnamed protein product [Owenia fusiformis]
MSRKRKYYMSNTRKKKSLFLILQHQQLPGRYPKRPHTNIKCNAPEKETSDIAKALHHCSDQLTEGTTLHSQNRLEYHRQQTLETIKTLATTTGHVEADKLAEQYRREASKQKEENQAKNLVERDSKIKLF